ncbi:DoxX family protein [bacterium]|nr:DoxX family protein [bacterium]
MRLDMGLLFLRVFAGGMMLLSHGWAKLSNYGTLATTFPDPLGMGVGFTLGVAIFAEFFCSLLVVLGLSTRLATIPLIGTMLTAAFVVHAMDPFDKKEFALIYATCFITIFLTGPGAFSLDAFARLRGRR